MNPGELRNRLLDNASRLRNARARDNRAEITHLEAEQDRLFAQRRTHAAHVHNTNHGIENP